ncbi:uncharacterized protein MELLADRAFT_68866 [Melampsora larici-populina 98AG31]|uniref:Uncharacterized protein n=1 Tax=Melampsora larici-populina (strain 98AG31 / pathotype 3-4-7) TaxID=747676 RepID=F4S8J5_MELLP|nr:uncharacterized protein MELLADRAFT_68866 [Melampsora larici-populina 98AG31]EGF99000.1 hypothetical protein MELLADRAFT_68866 [Melampsora larici-populina 98AG31]
MNASQDFNQSFREFLKVFNGNLEILDKNLKDFHSDSYSKFSEILKKEVHILEVVDAQYKELYRITRQDNKDLSSLDKKIVSFLNQFPLESLNQFLEKNFTSTLSLSDINENLLDFKASLNEFCENRESEKPSVVQNDLVMTTLIENLHEKLIQKLENKLYQDTSSSDEINKFLQDQNLAVENEKIQRSNFQDFLTKSVEEIKENQTQFENSTNSKLDRIENMLRKLTNDNQRDVEHVQEPVQSSTLPRNRVGSMVKALCCNRTIQW